MEVITLDVKGKKCPRPTLEMTKRVPELKEGDILEVIANCSTFENDVKIWCKRMRKALLLFKTEPDGVMLCQVKI